MDEIFKGYRLHPLMARMIAEIRRADTVEDPEVRSLAIDLLQQDMATQAYVANRGQIGWFLNEAVRGDDESED